MWFRWQEAANTATRTYRQLTEGVIAAKARGGLVASRRGRPPLSDDEGSTSVHVKLPDSVYDRAYERAADERVSVPEVIRRALERDLETQNRHER